MSLTRADSADAAGVPCRQFGEIAEGLDGQAEVIADRTAALVYRELPSYASVPSMALRASTRRNLNIALRALRSDRKPTPDELPEAVITVTERVQQRVPVEDMMRAYRINIGVIEEKFVDIAARLEMRPDLVLAGSRLLWSVGDAFTTRIALVYQELGIEHALHHAHRRSEFLHTLFDGSLREPELASRAALFGLDPSGRYLAVRGRCTADGRRMEEHRRQLEKHGSTIVRSALVGIFGGDFVGVVAHRPATVPGLTVAIGPEVALSNAAQSFATASRVLEGAWRLRKNGVFSLEDLSWRLAAVAEPAVGEYLMERYVESLRRQGPFGELLLDTLRVFLANGLSTARTAAALVIHPNTLRHRLQKVSELTGTDLDSTDVIVEIAWALELAAAGAPGCGGGLTSTAHLPRHRTGRCACAHRLPS